LKKEEILDKFVRTPSRVAVVGASPRPERAVSRVMNYLAGGGFTIFPVNPAYEGTKIGGRLCAASLESLGEAVDVVALFLSADKQGSVAEGLDKMPAKPVVWFQPGAENPSLAGELEKRGYNVIPSACLMEEHMNMRR
jgi:hypothetical protein